MRAIANRLPNTLIAGATPDKQKKFFLSRGWEADCGSFLPIDQTPDRLVFVVSLILLPLVLLI